MHLAPSTRTKQLRAPPLSVAQILAWADEHYAQTGRWPQADRTRVPGLEGIRWSAVDSALRKGNRGLTIRSTLARLLQAQRGKVIHRNLPDLSVRQIVDWADAHFLRHGRWPTSKTGVIPEQPTESWAAIDSALLHSRRGLSGRSSLLRLLAEHRGRRNHRALWPLSTEAILTWADRHRQQTGRWPTARSGRVLGAPQETWPGIDGALRHGRRGLVGGNSLVQLLVVERDADSPRYRAPLQTERIKQWADAYQARHGRWPMESSGPIPESDGETWAAVGNALRRGWRGLPGGTSLAQFLRSRRAVAER